MSNNIPKILCLFSAPLVDEKGNPVDSLNIETEREAIIKEFSACNRQIILRIDFATIDALARGIKDNFNILHFSGHGSKEHLAFEDGQGGCHLVDGKFLKKLIGIAAPFDVAMISACYSEPRANMVHKAGAKHVVAISRKSPILDQAAIKFAGIFYRHLFANDTVEHSFNMAKLLVEGDPQIAKIKPSLQVEACATGQPFVPEEKKFVLIPKSKPSVHQKPIWQELPRGVLKIEEIQRACTNLPVKSRSFRGRSKDIHEIIGHLLVNRFVTVTGAGGIGKTTATIEAARWFYLRGHFPDGIFIVNLRESASSSRIIDLIGACLNRQFASLKEIIQFIRESHMLFLLDNVEDVLYQDEKETQQVIEELLKFAPHIKIVATSQKPIGGNLHETERIFRMNVMNSRDSVQLFISTSRRPISKQELESKDFRQLMEQLGGHPLSIVLMSGQLTHGVTIGELLARIKVEKAKAIQIRGISDKRAEHGESLVASLLSSFNNLDNPSKKLFTVLSMFPAGVFKFFIENVFGNDSWDTAHKLNDASLGEIVSKRITLLPPVRLFAESLLSLEIKEKYGPKIVEHMSDYSHVIYEGFQSKEGIMYRSIFAIEEPNLRYATGLPTIFKKDERTNNPSPIGALTHFLMSLYELSYRINEAKNLGYSMIPELEKIGDTVGLARVLHEIGCANRQIGQLDESKENLEKALKLFREVGSYDGKVNTLIELGHILIYMNDFPRAIEYLENALRVAHQYYEKHGKDGKYGEADAYSQLADIYMLTNDFPKSKEYLENALKIYQQLDQKLGETSTLFKLGHLFTLMNDFPNAKEYLENALKIYQEIKEDVSYEYTKNLLMKITSSSTSAQA